MHFQPRQRHEPLGPLMKLLLLSSFPAVNALLNGLCAIFLICGYFCIQRGKMRAHKVCMLFAFACSTVFLSLYLYFHAHAGIIRFGGLGWIRPVYFTLLTTHTALAAAIVPLVLITLTRALSERLHRHRKIARWTLPIWLYVSITGVVVYCLLYIAYTPIGARGVDVANRLR